MTTRSPHLINTVWSTMLLFKGLTRPAILVLGHIISWNNPNPEVHTPTTVRNHSERLNIFIFLKTIFRDALKMDSFGQTTEVSSPNFLYTICWVFSLTVTKASGKRASTAAHWPSCPEHSSKCQILFSSLEKLRKGIFSRIQVMISDTYKGTLFKNNSAWIAV